MIARPFALTLLAMDLGLAVGLWLVEVGLSVRGIFDKMGPR